MNIEKIEINGHYVWVDKDAEIKEGELVCGGLGGNDIKKYGKYFANDWYKIIAASPELNLERIPSSYVEWLAIAEIMNEDAKDGLYEFRPTWDDVRKAMNYASQITNNKLKYMDDYIEQLKQSKNK